MGKKHLTAAQIFKNAEKDSDRMHKERLNRCVPIAREIQAICLRRNLPMGDDVQNSKEYQEAALEILQLMLTKEVHYVDREFIFQLALQPVSFTKDICTNSITNGWTMTLQGLFGKPMADLTMKDVDEQLKKVEA